MTTVRRMEAEANPEPATFEANRKIFTRHTPGDTRPCDAKSRVVVLTTAGESLPDIAESFDWQATSRDRRFFGVITGWRYADQEAGDPAMFETRPSNIMLDLETLGTNPGCVILSIGAVLFGNGSLHDEFYIRISLKSAQESGLTIDADTLQWWTRQPHEVFAEAMAGGNSLDAALVEFKKWIENLHLPPNWTIWSNGASFDAPVLEAAFRQLGMQPPWTHSQERCFRTLRALDPSEPKVEPAIKHHALEDAKAQALHAMRIAPWL